MTTKEKIGLSAIMCFCLFLCFAPFWMGLLKSKDQAPSQQVIGHVWEIEDIAIRHDDGTLHKLRLVHFRHDEGHTSTYRAKLNKAWQKYNHVVMEIAPEDQIAGYSLITSVADCPEKFKHYDAMGGGTEIDLGGADPKMIEEIRKLWVAMEDLKKEVEAAKNTLALQSADYEPTEEDFKQIQRMLDVVSKRSTDTITARLRNLEKSEFGRALELLPPKPH